MTSPETLEQFAGSIPPGADDIVRTIALALARNYTPHEILNWNSPIRDRIQEYMAESPQLKQASDSSSMVEVTKVDANNYCRILRVLGMEEEGDPVAEVERLLSLEEDASKLENVSMVMRRLILALRRTAPDESSDLHLANRAADLLRRLGLDGSPLREAP